MAWWIPVAAGVSALGGVASSLLTNKSNEAATEYATNMDYKKWREYLEYSSPDEQVRRMRKAGINPAIAMGQGAIDSGNPSSPAPETRYPTYDFSPISQGITQSAQLFQQARLSESQRSNLNSLTEGQTLRNMTQIQRDMAEIDERLSKVSENSAQADLLRKQKNFLQKELDTYDERWEVARGLQLAQSKNELSQALRASAETDSVQIENEFRKMTNPIRAKQMEADLMNAIEDISVKKTIEWLNSANANRVEELTPYERQKLYEDIWNTSKNTEWLSAQIGLSRAETKRTLEMIGADKFSRYVGSISGAVAGFGLGVLTKLHLPATKVTGFR